MTNHHEKFKTEYSASYVWHDNAYTNKPERLHYIRGRIRNGTLFSRHKGSLQQLSQPQLTQLQQQQQLWKSVLHLPLHQSPRRLEAVEKETHEDDNQLKISTKKQSTRPKQRRTASTRRYSLEADARGIKSHFLPASLNVLLDLGISSCKSTTTTRDDEGGGDVSEGRKTFTGMMTTMETGDSEKCGSDQYFTSVYKKDFSGSDKPEYFNRT